MKNETKTSSVCTYGDHSTTEKKTSEYFGIIESKNGGDDDDDDDDAAKITQQELSAEICYQKYKPSNNCMKKIISAYINAHGNFAEHNKYYIEKFIRNLCIDSAKKNVN